MTEQDPNTADISSASELADVRAEVEAISASLAANNEALRELLAERRRDRASG